MSGGARDEERIARLYTREGQERKQGAPWHRDHDACTGCGTMVRPHHSGGRCASCAGVRRRDADDPRERTEPSKRCARCGLELPLRRFHRDAHMKGGYHSSCKRCRRPLQAAVHARRRARKQAYHRAYAEAHRDDIRAGRRAQRAHDVAAARERERYEYHQRDKAKIAERVRERRHAARREDAA